MKNLFTLVLFTFFSLSSTLNAQMLPDNWTGDSGIDVFQESSDVHGGSYSARVDVKTGSQGSCDFDNSTVIPVTAGDTYTVKFWYKTSDHVKARIVIKGDDGSTKWGAFTVAGATTWTELSYSNTVPSGVTSFTLDIRFYDQSGFTAPETQYIDDLTFESPTGTALTVTNGDLESWPGGGSGPDDPAGFAATAASTSEIDLSWALNSAGDDAMVAWSNDGTFGTPADGSVYTAGDVITGGGTVLYNGNGTSFNHIGLTASTHYFYKAWSVDGTNAYSGGVTTDASTNHAGSVKLPNHWLGDSGIETYKNSTTVHTGNHSCEVVVNTGSQSSCDFSNEDAIAVTPGTTYLYQFWIFSSNHVQGRAIVDFYKSDGSFLATQYGNYNTTTGAWDQVKKSGTVPADAATAKVRVRFYDQQGFVPGESQYVDDFTFESPTGTALTVSNGDMETWGSVPVVPLNNWSIAVAILLMLSLLVYGYKRRIA